MSRLSNP